jgi:tRNA U34 5-methylaminomethyl-2-thiouridine-forming methyltransferase MnmC
MMFEQENFLKMKIELVRTQDGSDSLYRQDIDEQYHSSFGAMQESMHIFIRSGFQAVPKNELQVFEMGFGTGLNVLLTLLAAREKQKKVKFFSIEKYPVPSNLIDSLNYPFILSPESPEIFKTIHSSEWDKDINIGGSILHKIHGDILEIPIPAGNDLVYFDAFSPGKDPLLWNESLFVRIYDSMVKGGIFVTYSAKGDVKRALMASGFRIEKLEGPPGKKHILRAFK